MAIAPDLAGPAPEPTGINASIFAVCQAISSTLELEPLLDLVLTLATEELLADQGSVLLIDRSSDELKMLATRGMPREVADRGYIPRKGSIAEWVIDHEDPLILDDDLKSDARFSSIARERGFRSSMCLPLQAKGRVIGTLNITRSKSGKRFGPQDLNTAQIMASQAALAIENARLHSEVLQATRLATLGQTVSGISHCIKNILTGLRGGMTVAEIAMESNDTELREKGWGMLKRNIERISLLVLDMLDFSKSRQPARGLVDPAELINDVVEAAAPQAQEAEVMLRLELDHGATPLNVDSDQIFRCLLNVITNAIDASPSHGEVVIRTSRVEMEPAEGTSALTVIEVSDHGAGIPKHLVDKIFDPFYSTKGSKGTGLGMPVTRKIIEEHQGALEIQSEPGVGTKVRIVLPDCAGGQTH
jgi:signal transduction histidine kinase